MPVSTGKDEFNRRLQAALALYAFATLGVFLVIAPWTAVWEQAVLALVPAGLRDVFSSGWLRGAVSGLGGFDLAIALQVAVEARRRADKKKGGEEVPPAEC